MTMAEKLSPLMERTLKEYRTRRTLSIMRGNARGRYQKWGEAPTLDELRNAVFTLLTDEEMTVEEVAQYMGVNRQTMYHWVRNVFRFKTYWARSDAPVEEQQGGMDRELIKDTIDYLASLPHTEAAYAPHYSTELQAMLDAPAPATHVHEAVAPGETDCGI